MAERGEHVRRSGIEVFSGFDIPRFRKAPIDYNTKKPPLGDGFLFDVKVMV